MMGQMVRDVLMMLEAQYIDRARDLASAVNILRLGRIDVLITEWALGTDGNTTGMDIVHWVRNDAGSPNRMMPIRMVTANSAPADVCRARDCGVPEFVAQNSEERRVGKEGVNTCRYRWSPCHQK